MGSSLAPGDAVPRTPADAARLRTMMEQDFDFIWCQLRRLGLSDDGADDAAQQVFIVASQRLADIASGSERSFLFGTALRVASDMRRAAARRREQCDEDVDATDPSPGADELLDRRRARAALDRVLDEVSFDARVVLVLFELEEMSMAQIAQFLSVPMGTVAARGGRAGGELVGAG
jgi:RNA polymerase sigma-70 factor (ECF subfamily)